MKTITDPLQKNRSYFFGCVTLLVAGISLLLTGGQQVLAVPLNSPHPSLLNVFFINYTFIGDGFFAIILVTIILFYFKKKQQGYALLNAILLSMISIQLVKNFGHFANPTLFFEQGQYLFSIEGIGSVNDPAMASGHTAIAFAIATVFMGMTKHKKWQIPVLLAAALVAYSRMYLAQHSLLSVMIGATIGTGFGIVSLLATSGKIKLNRSGKKRIPYAHRGTVAYQ